MATSPNVLNYFIGKGIIKFTPTGGVERDLGNAPEVELTPEIEKLDHFSSRTGVRSKDRSIVLEKGLTLRVVLEENTPENLAMLLLGTPEVNGEGNTEFEIFENSEVTGSISFTGTNDVGNKVNVTLGSVSFGPTGSLSLISDEWGNIELTGEVLSTELDGFGTIEVVEVEEVS